MNLGAEPKKVAVLGSLILVAAVTLYVNVFSSDLPSPAPRAIVSPSPSVAPAVAVPQTVTVRKRERAKISVAEFKPRQGAARPEDRPDPASIDPALRLDLLAKVQAVEPEAAIRNLFQYGVAPAPPKPIELPKNPPKIAINQPPPPPPPPANPGPSTFTPPPPQAPPMTFKYYGFKTLKSTGRKQAFLLDGDDIFIAGENESVKGARYKIVKIGVNSITIEDTQFKATQTLQLQEENAA